MNIKLYHGSNTTFEHIDLGKSQQNKDFGRGFYLTDIYEQAEAMAVRRTRITGTGTPTITTYAFDDDCLRDNSLQTKLFGDTPTEEWALFILANRSSGETGFSHPYDIVVGPVADDGVVFQLERYQEKIIDLSTLVKELTYRKLNRQYYFGTPTAISKLLKL